MIRSMSSGGSSGWARSVFEHMEVMIEDWINATSIFLSSSVFTTEAGQRKPGK